MKFDRVPEEKAGKGKLIFGITEPDKLEKIINILGYDVRQLTALLEKYSGECEYNVGAGHVLGALAVEWEELL